MLLTPGQVDRCVAADQTATLSTPLSPQFLGSFAVALLAFGMVGLAKIRAPLNLLGAIPAEAKNLVVLVRMGRYLADRAGSRHARLLVEDTARVAVVLRDKRLTATDRAPAFGHTLGSMVCRILASLFQMLEAKLPIRLCLSITEVTLHVPIARHSSWSK
jgi:hypothetical protein